MWDTYRLSTWGNFSLRKIALSFAAVLLSALFMAIANSATTFADSATWEGETIKIGDKTYTKMANPPSVIPGILSDNTEIYQAADGNNISIIAVRPGADKTKEITDAQIGTFKKDDDGNYTTSGADPPKYLTIAASSSAANENGGEGENKTSCDIAGVGWIICGPSRWIANGMDLIYGWISDFLIVKPLSTDTDNGMYQAWEVVRGIANACFILAFLAIIYAQITSYGISNYEIKKMVPKLIIAAILVNVSYYICAIAVDLSNILGNSIQDAFIQVRDSLRETASSGGWDASAFTFKNITEYLLSGGTIGAAAFAGWTAFTGATIGGTISGLIFMLFPILVAGILSVTVALVILAARQALITVLIVISPLAFVAFLLPNTEKWFEKWRGVFTTMLMVFPMFALLFGGSQLASFIILQNADQLTVVLLALFIQVAPLALTPFLVRFSGSLLGRIAGMLNNPQKGIIDSTRNWATDRAETRAARGRERAAKGGGTFGQRAAFKRDLGKMNRDAWKKRGQSYLDASWHNDSRYQDHHDALGESELMQKSGEAKANAHFERRRARDPGLQRYVATQRINDDVIKNLQARENAEWEEAKAADMHADNRFAHKHTAAMAESEQAQMLAYRTGTAQAMQRIDYAKALTGAVDANATVEVRAAAELRANSLAKAAGGIDSGGADSARANALAALKKSKLESIAEGRALSQYYNLGAADRQKLALGIEVEGIADNGSKRKFNITDSEYVRLAAIEDQVSQGTVEEALELILRTGKNPVTNEERELYKHREVIVDAMIKGGLPQKAAFLGGKTLDDVRGGNLKGTGDLLRAAATQVAKGKLSAEVLLNQDKTAMDVLVEAVKQAAHGQIQLEGDNAHALPVELEKLFASAYRAVNDPRINSRLGERGNAMNDLADMGINGTGLTPPRPPQPSGGTPPPAPTGGPSPAGGPGPMPPQPGMGYPFDPDEI